MQRQVPCEEVNVKIYAPYKVYDFEVLVVLHPG